MNNSEITVIIPAFNAERTLERTVSSVTAQTFKDIEVIIVDDGSTDSTGAIADRLAASNNRLKVIHQANAGCYAARLAGMKEVRSPYFGFVDADDFIEPIMYEHLLRFAKDNKLDIAQCDWFGHKRNNGVPQVFETHEAVVSQVILPRLVEGVDAMMVWDKIYRNQYDFSNWVEGDFATHEDLIHNMQLFKPACRVGYLNNELYNYTVTDGSSTRNFSEKRITAFRNTISAHKELALDFGLNSFVVDDLCDKWTVRNARNLLIQAVCATTVKLQSGISYARGIMSIPEVNSALLEMSSSHDSAVRFMRTMRMLPLSVSVPALRMLQAIRHLIK